MEHPVVKIKISAKKTLKFCFLIGNGNVSGIGLMKKILEICFYAKKNKEKKDIEMLIKFVLIPTVVVNSGNLLCGFLLKTSQQMVFARKITNFENHNLWP